MQFAAIRFYCIAGSRLGAHRLIDLLVCSSALVCPWLRFACLWRAALHSSLTRSRLGAGSVQRECTASVERDSSEPKLRLAHGVANDSERVEQLNRRDSTRVDLPRLAATTRTALRARSGSATNGFHGKKVKLVLLPRVRAERAVLASMPSTSSFATVLGASSCGDLIAFDDSGLGHLTRVSSPRPPRLG